MPEHRIALTRTDLLHLFKGGELAADGVRIILSDIGFDVVLKLLCDASEQPSALTEVRTVQQEAQPGNNSGH